MNLNGWKRIGIVASVVWILGAGVHTLNVESEAVSQTAANLTLNCEQAHDVLRGTECDARGKDYIAENLSYARIDAAIVAFIPVPVGWGFISLILFLVRWIKRGFV